MGNLRPRYNAKARGLLNGPKKRKHGETLDTNADIIDPTRVKANDVDRPAPATSGLGKASSRKRRRLESYTNKKLKQERRVQLLKELAESSQSLPDSLALRTTASLGSGHATTSADMLDRVGQLANRKRDRVKAKVAEAKRGYHSDSDGIMSDEEDDEVDDSMDQVDATVRSAEPPLASTAIPILHNGLGSGLKRNADGSLPAIVVKPKRPKTTWGRKPKMNVTPSSSASSFDSSDSALDSDEDDDSGSASDGNDLGDDDAESEAESWYGFDGSDEAVKRAETTAETEPPDTSSKTGFKDWARAQVDASKGLQSIDAPVDLTSASHRVDRPYAGGPADGVHRGPLGEDIVPIQPTSLLSGPTSAKAAVKAVEVDRPEAIQEARLKLPILAEEEAIMDAIRQNSVVVICGETGSGKTTQVPQFLYEAGFGSRGSENPGMIAITQPRRVAAVSMANRVAAELNTPAGKVAYQIRYDTTTSPGTAIKFMTDGVLLRELGADLLLSRYSVVIIDEAHERTLNTDILIGVLSRAVRLREEDWRAGKTGAPGPLRLIIMSATLRVADFAENTRLFASPPPVISVPARQFSVTTHFSRRTKPDYLGEAYSKVCKIHARLPPGGVLVFLTSQAEITTLCRRLEKRFGKAALEARRQRRAQFAPPVPVKPEIDAQPLSNATGMVEADDVEAEAQGELAADVDDGAEVDEDDQEALDSSDDEDEDEENAALQIFDDETSDVPMHVLPLYSLLPQDKQMRVFQPPPEGHRLIVVATNVAETSLTIPHIRYVVDSGRAKARHHDLATGMQAFRVEFVSKASASQRAGRAGRTGPGHCYRLYSSAVYESAFETHAPPEILRMPVDGIVLQMKAMGLTRVAKFPFPTPPDSERLLAAEKALIRLGALDTTPQAGITPLGQTMSLFPLAPRYSRMLAGAAKGKQVALLPYVIAIVCALSTEELFVRADRVGGPEEKDDDEVDAVGEKDEDPELNTIRNADVKEKAERKAARRSFYRSLAAFEALGDGTSDVFTMLAAVCAYEYEARADNDSFCRKHFLRLKAMTEVHKLRMQISRLVQDAFPGLDAGFEPRLSPPSATELHALRQLLTSAFIDHIAVRKDLVDSAARNTAQASSTRGVPYRAVGVPEDVFVHPGSALFHEAPPDVVAYAELTRGNKPWLRTATRIDKAWLAKLGGSLCSVVVLPEKAAAQAKPNAQGELRRPCVVRRTFDAGGLDLDLGVEPREQRMDRGRWILV